MGKAIFHALRLPRRIGLKWAFVTFSAIAILLAIARWIVDTQVAELNAERRAVSSILLDHNIVLASRTGCFTSWLLDLTGRADASQRIIDIDAPWCGITDRLVKNWSGLGYIERLNLDANPISDVGLKVICSSRYAGKLKSLNLGGTDITNAGISMLNSLRSLKFLGLGGFKINDEGIGQLRNKSIKTLVLTNTEITDQGLNHIGQQMQVLELNISDTNCTSEGLAKYIRKYCLPPQKYVIYADGIGVTEEQEAEIAKERPNVKIIVF